MKTSTNDPFRAFVWFLMVIAALTIIGTCSQKMNGQNHIKQISKW